MKKLLLILILLFPLIVYGEITNNSSHAPPDDAEPGGDGYDADYGYNPPGDFDPADDPGVYPAQCGTYTEPVFGETVKRITDNYGKGSPDAFTQLEYMITKMSADSSYVLATDLDGWSHVYQVSNCSVVRANIDLGGSNTGNGQFSLNDDDIIYYWDGSNLRQYDVDAGSSSLIKSFGATINTGGSLNFSARVQASGGTTSGGDRYFLGATLSALRFYDAQEDTFYSNQPSRCTGYDFATIAPDGSGALCSGSGQWWYPVDHSSNTWGSGTKVYSTSPHSDLVSASDGTTYLVIPEPNGVKGATCTGSTGDQGDTIYKISLPSYGNAGCGSAVVLDRNHTQSCAGMGRAVSPNEDWFLVAGYVNEANLNDPDPWDSWAPFKAEMYLVDVLTGDVRRLAHNRSRVVSWDYTAQPHGSISPDGAYVVFDTNLGVTAGTYKEVLMGTTGLVAEEDVAPIEGISID